MTDLVSEIEHIREKNNQCWMKLLRIALIAQPERTRAILKQIVQNDRNVTEHLQRIIDGC